MQYTSGWQGRVCTRKCISCSRRQYNTLPTFQFIVVDETLNERVERAEVMLFETMHKVIEKRQNIDSSMNHALTKQLEEHSRHLHGEGRVKMESLLVRM